MKMYSSVYIVVLAIAISTALPVEDNFIAEEQLVQVVPETQEAEEAVVGSGDNLDLMKLSEDEMATRINAAVDAALHRVRSEALAADTAVLTEDVQSKGSAAPKAKKQQLKKQVKQFVKQNKHLFKPAAKVQDAPSNRGLTGDLHLSKHQLKHAHEFARVNDTPLYVRGQHHYRHTHIRGDGKWRRKFPADHHHAVYHFINQTRFRKVYIPRQMRRSQTDAEVKAATQEYREHRALKANKKLRHVLKKKAGHHVLKHYVKDKISQKLASRARKVIRKSLRREHRITHNDRVTRNALDWAHAVISKKRDPNLDPHRTLVRYLKNSKSHHWDEGGGGFDKKNAWAKYGRIYKATERKEALRILKQAQQIEHETKVKDRVREDTLKKARETKTHKELRVAKKKDEDMQTRVHNSLANALNKMKDEGKVVTKTKVLSKPKDVAGTVSNEVARRMAMHAWEVKEGEKIAAHDAEEEGWLSDKLRGEKAVAHIKAEEDHAADKALRHKVKRVLSPNRWHGSENPNVPRVDADDSDDDSGYPEQWHHGYQKEWSDGHDDAAHGALAGYGGDHKQVMHHIYQWARHEANDAKDKNGENWGDYNHDDGVGHTHYQTETNYRTTSDVMHVDDGDGRGDGYGRDGVYDEPIPDKHGKVVNEDSDTTTTTTTTTDEGGANASNDEMSYLDKELKSSGDAGDKEWVTKKKPAKKAKSKGQGPTAQNNHFLNKDKKEWAAQMGHYKALRNQWDSHHYSKRRDVKLEDGPATHSHIRRGHSAWHAVNQGVKGVKSVVKQVVKAHKQAKERSADAKQAYKAKMDVEKAKAKLTAKAEADYKNVKAKQADKLKNEVKHVAAKAHVSEAQAAKAVKQTNGWAGTNTKAQQNKKVQQVVTADAQKAKKALKTVKAKDAKGLAELKKKGIKVPAYTLWSA